MNHKYYHDVLKESSTKSAPAYMKPKQNDESGIRYRCTICGYI